MASTAEFRTRRGRIRPLAISFISVLAVVSAVFSGLPTPAMVMAVLAVALAAYRGLNRLPGHAIRIDRSAAPSLDGRRGRLMGEAVTGAFVALRLVAPDGTTRRAFLFRDELEPDDYRALLAYLRHG